MITSATPFLTRFAKQNSLNSGSLYCSHRCKSTNIPFFGNFSRVNIINTNVELKGEDLEVNRTSYIGLKSIPDSIFSSQQSILNNETSFQSTNILDPVETDELPESSQDPSLQQLPLPENVETDFDRNEFSYFNPIQHNSLHEVSDKKRALFEKFRGIVFQNTEEGNVELINYFFVNSQNIAWNQTTLLALMFFKKELNGSSDTKINTDDYTSELRKYGVKSGNWTISIKKYFDVSEEESEKTSIISLNKNSSSSLTDSLTLNERLEVIDQSLKESCEALSQILNSWKQGKRNIISQNQVVHTLSCLSNCQKLSFKDLTASLSEEKISTANYLSSLTSKTMTPIFIIDKTEMEVSLSRNKYLFEILKNFSSEISKKNSISKEESQEKLGEIFRPAVSDLLKEPIDKPVSNLSNQNEYKRLYTFNGTVSLFKEPQPKVYFHLPTDQLRDTMDNRKIIIGLAIRAISKIGISFLSFQEANQMLLDNRFSKINLPRDLKNNENFSLDLEKKTISLTNPNAFDSNIAEISNYQVEKKDITKKMEDLIPIIKAITEKTKDFAFLSSDLRKECHDSKVHVALPRDLPRIFGFSNSDRTYISPKTFKQAVSILSINQKEKKKVKK